MKVGTEVFDLGVRWELCRPVTPADSANLRHRPVKILGGEFALVSKQG